MDIPLFKERTEKLQVDLKQHANPQTKAWWENYVKGSPPFLGVKMPIIRTVVHHWYKEGVDGQMTGLEQVTLALQLFDGEYTEEKLAGTLLLQEILLPSGAVEWQRDVDRFAALFTEGKIYDWNTCDWFCVKVLGPLIQENGLACAQHIAQWRQAENLWQARAALVAFVNVAGSRAYYPIIEASCQVLIRRPERFAKTAVGWILREVSKVDEPFVHQVISGNVRHFSAESLKNATKYFSREQQKHYREMLKQNRKENDEHRAKSS
jgi:3-methyladenine DNA glycosylase AlkD